MAAPSPYVAYGMTWWASALATTASTGVVGAAVMTAFYVSAASREERDLAALRLSPTGAPAAAKGALR